MEGLLNTYIFYVHTDYTIDSCHFLLPLTNNCKNAENKLVHLKTMTYSIIISLNIINYCIILNKKVVIKIYARISVGSFFLG